MILSPRWRSILCDLWVHKTRTILIVLSVAVGVFAIGVITSSRQMLTRTIQVGYAAVSPASAVVYTTTYFDDALVQAVRNVRGVREAEGRQSVIVRFQVGQDEWRTMQLTAIADYDDIRINKLWPESKVWPPPEHEVLIERAHHILRHVAAELRGKPLQHVSGGASAEIFPYSECGLNGLHLTESNAYLFCRPEIRRLTPVSSRADVR